MQAINARFANQPTNPPTHPTQHLPLGNTKLLSAWYDEGGVLQNLSRKLKFGMLPIWGRFGLPLLYRQPVLGVMAAPIMCPKVEGEPSQEMIDKYHTEFCDALVKLFDCYKGAYGWPDKQLLLK